jgi:predicted porin
MNKKLVTLAVAAALAAPAAAMADATLYGKLNMSIDYFDIDNGFNGWTLNKGRVGKGQGRANRVGVKGSEDLGGGLKAVYQIELGVSMANEQDYAIANGDPGTIQMRNTFVGLAGGWGTFLVGRHDTPMKISTGKLDLFSDTVADYNLGGNSLNPLRGGFMDVRADNAIAYISPSFSGFQFAGAVVPGSASTTTGARNDDSDSIAEGYSLAAIYSNGPFYGSVAYESFGQDLLATDYDISSPYADSTVAGTLYPVGNYCSDGAGGLTMAGCTGLLTSRDDLNKWRAGLGLLDWNGFTLTGVYENDDLGDDSANVYQVQAGYAFGNNMIKGMYLWNEIDYKYLKDVSPQSWAIGFDHSFSKRTKAYAVYTDYDADLSRNIGDWSAFSLGMMHSF